MYARLRAATVALGSAALLLSTALPGIAQSPDASGSASAMAPDGLYARLLEKGTMRVSIELNYAPEVLLDAPREEATRQFLRRVIGDRTGAAAPVTEP